jgi:hypothetical protein
MEKMPPAIEHKQVFVGLDSFAVKVMKLFNSFLT